MPNLFSEQDVYPRAIALAPPMPTNAEIIAVAEKLKDAGEEFTLRQCSICEAPVTGMIDRLAFATPGSDAIGVEVGDLIYGIDSNCGCTRYVSPPAFYPVGAFVEAVTGDPALWGELRDRVQS